MTSTIRARGLRSGLAASVVALLLLLPACSLLSPPRDGGQAPTSTTTEENDAMISTLTTELAAVPGVVEPDASWARDGLARVLSIGLDFSDQPVDATTVDDVLRTIAAHVDDEATYVRIEQNAEGQDLESVAAPLGVPESAFTQSGRAISLPLPWFAEHYPDAAGAR